MKFPTTLLLASTLLLSWVPCPAGEPYTIPPDIAQKMKKGSKLVRVWTAPEFDGSKGFRLGQLTDETDGSAAAALDFFPGSLQKFIKKDSLYILHLAVVDLKLKKGNSGPSSAALEVEGRILDQSGKIVAAFIGYAMDSIGGNANDNARMAVNKITFAMAKDLVQSALPTEDRSPAVIVATPPAPVLPAPTTPAPTAVPAPAPVVAALPPVTPAPKPTVAPAPAPVATPKDPAVPLPVTTLIPANLLAELKAGAALDRVWMSPAYSKSSGFALGEVRYQVETRNDGVDKVFPEALAEIANPEAPCRLELQIVELSIRTRSNGGSNIGLGVEGRLVTPDGTLLAAFKTRETVTGIGDLVDDCRMATRKVVQAIAKDLK